ncbi:hypothetical protein D3C79_1085960 [compost metagenome]
MREDHLGMARGEVLSGFRGACLDENGPSLGGPSDIQLALHGEELAFMIQPVELGGVVEPAVLFVVEEGIVLPGIP